MTMIGACDKNHHANTPQTYGLSNCLGEQDCKLRKVSYLVYFDWYEEIEMKAHLPQMQGQFQLSTGEVDAQMFGACL